METVQTNGTRNKALAMTGTASKLCRLYVDSNAASAGANGTAQKPFKTIGDALARCPTEVVEAEGNVTEFRVIEVSGVHKGVTIDRPIVITGTYYLENVTVNLDPDGNSYCMFTGEGFVQTMDLTAPSVDFLGATAIGRIDLTHCNNLTFKNADVLCGLFFVHEDMSLNFRNCTVMTKLTLPTGCNAIAINSSLMNTENTGTIQLINSYQRT